MKWRDEERNSTKREAIKKNNKWTGAGAKCEFGQMVSLYTCWTCMYARLHFIRKFIFISLASRMTAFEFFLSFFFGFLQKESKQLCTSIFFCWFSFCVTCLVTPIFVVHSQFLFKMRKKTGTKQCNGFCGPWYFPLLLLLRAPGDFFYIFGSDCDALNFWPYCTDRFFGLRIFIFAWNEYQIINRLQNIGWRGKSVNCALVETCKKL